MKGTSSAEDAEGLDSAVQDFLRRTLDERRREFESEISVIVEHYRDWYERWSAVLKYARLSSRGEDYEATLNELINMDPSDHDAMRSLLEPFGRAIEHGLIAVDLNPHEIYDRLPQALALEEEACIFSNLGAMVWMRTKKVAGMALVSNPTFSE